MKRTYLIVLLLLTISSPLVFSQRRPIAKSKTPGRQVKPIKAAQVKDEAYDQALKVWSEYLTRCGDSYYMRTPGICEYRSVSIFNKEKALSEADKLNGIERELVSNVEAKARRCQKRDGEWGAWESGPYLVVGLIKKSGTWTVDYAPRYNNVFLMQGQIFDSYPGVELKNTKISCSDVPGFSPSETSTTDPVNRTSSDVPRVSPWVTQLRSSPVVPGVGLAGIKLGEPESRVIELLGEPTLSFPVKNVSGQVLYYALTYRDGSVFLGVYTSVKERLVKSFRLSDGTSTKDGISQTPRSE